MAHPTGLLLAMGRTAWMSGDMVDVAFCLTLPLERDEESHGFLDHVRSAHEANAVDQGVDLGHRFRLGRERIVSPGPWTIGDSTSLGAHTGTAFLSTCIS